MSWGMKTLIMIMLEMTAFFPYVKLPLKNGS
jgi:hypothetical protein